MKDEFDIESHVQITPTVREATISEASDELESCETFFNNLKKRDGCPSCGRNHGNFPERCERIGEIFVLNG